MCRENEWKMALSNIIGDFLLKDIVRIVCDYSPIPHRWEAGPYIITNGTRVSQNLSSPANPYCYRRAVSDLSLNKNPSWTIRCSEFPADQLFHGMFGIAMKSALTPGLPD